MSVGGRYSDAQLEKAAAEVYTHGPLPPEVWITTISPTDHRIFYCYQDGDGNWAGHDTTHPLSAAGLKMLIPTAYNNEPKKPRDMDGVRQPEVCRVGDWAWSCNGQDIIAAASLSVSFFEICSQRETLRRLPHNLEANFRNEYNNFGNHQVMTMYHPKDRQLPLLSGEDKMAEILRKIGYSLVIVQATQATDNIESLFDHEAQRNAPITRWSTSQDSELRHIQSKPCVS